MFNSNEIWKNIVEYEELYQVSSYGRIKRFNKDERYRSFKILKPHKINDYGHLKTDLYKNGLRESFQIHRLVLEAFVGICPVGMECCHNDGNSSNNFIGNLRWDTRLENVKDKNKHKTMPIGSRHGMAKLNELQVRIIKRLLEDDYLTQREIAKIFDIDWSTIWRIKHNKTWRHVKI